jgi:hypothetical protein
MDDRRATNLNEDPATIDRLASPLALWAAVIAPDGKATTTLGRLE